MVGIDGGSDGIPVHRQGNGPPCLGGTAQRTLRVETQVEKASGGVVPSLVVAAVAHRVGGHQVYIHQRNFPGVEGINQLVALADRMQADNLNGQLVLLPPPAGPGGEGQAFVIPGEHVGPGASGTVPLPQSDGNIQKQGQGAVGPAEGDHNLVGDLLRGGNGGHIGQPLPETTPLGAGQVERVSHRLSGEGSAVGKSDPGAQGKGPHQLVLADRVALTQHRLSLKGSVHLKQSLVQKGGKRKVGPVGG